ncbi:MAG: DUF4124 domain-containing protein [Thioalkalivibrio sp.]|nr:DUF4124 domain-containing protein [Thioalkalivibrio sp.]
MKQTIRMLALLLPLAALLFPPADARIYRWTDDAGVVHYSTTPPPSAADRELRILDNEGRQRHVRPAPPTAEERERAAKKREEEQREAEQREREQAQRQAEAAAREQRSRQLRAAYASVDEIRRQRDRRVEMVETTLMLSERQEATLQSELERIAAQMRSSQVDEPTMARYREEFADLESRIHREWAFQRRQREMLAEITSSAEQDMRDFERLMNGASH